MHNKRAILGKDKVIFFPHNSSLIVTAVLGNELLCIIQSLVGSILAFYTMILSLYFYFTKQLSII